MVSGLRIQDGPDLEILPVVRPAEAREVMKVVRSVVVEPGCIVCGICESLAPAVFEVLDDGAVVRPVTAAGLRSDSEAIWDAESDCPVDVIVASERANP